MSIHTIRKRSASANVHAAGVVALPLLAVVTLHGVAARPWAQIVWTDLPTWLATTPPEEATVALARILCLGVSYWLLFGTCVAVVHRLFDVRWATALSQHVTPPAVRRFVDRTVVATAATGVLVTGAALPAADVAPTPVAYADVVAPPPPGLSPPPPQEGPTLDERDEGEGAPAEQPEAEEAPAATDADAQEDDRSSDETHTVVPGENLWAIAHHHLAEAREVPIGDVSTAEIVGYWREVIAVNRERLRSGDPDLIYPGERILLPPDRAERHH